MYNQSAHISDFNWNFSKYKHVYKVSCQIITRQIVMSIKAIFLLFENQNRKKR